MKIIIEGDTGSELRKQILSLAEEYIHTPVKEDRDSILIMEMQESHLMKLGNWHKVVESIWLNIGVGVV